MKCCICDKEEDERWMYSFNTGCRKLWLCSACWLNAQREATVSDIHRFKQLHRAAEDRKRRK